MTRRYWCARSTSTTTSASISAGACNTPVAIRTSADSYRIADVSRSLYTLGMPVSQASTEALFLQAVAEHRFSNDWMFRGSVQSNHFDGERNALGHYGVMSPEGLLPVTLYDNENDDDVFSGEVNLFGDVEMWFGRETHCSSDFDYARYDGNQQQGYLIASGELTGFGVNNLDFGLLPRRPGSVRAYDPDTLPEGSFDEVGLFKGKYDNKEYGATVQSILKPTGRLERSSSACATRRRSWPPWNTAVRRWSTTSRSGRIERIDTDGWTYQAGLTYAITPKINGYRQLRRYDRAAYGCGRGRQLSSRPERGKSYEIGLKGDLYAGRLSWSAALFRLERGPLAESVLNTPYSRCSASSALRASSWMRRARCCPAGIPSVAGGHEERVYRRRVRRLSDAVRSRRRARRCTRAMKSRKGHGAVSAPAAASVYETSWLDPAILWPGRGATFTDLFDDYTEVDLRVFYNGVENWRFEVGVTNLFNELYYSPDGQDLSIEYGISPNPAREIIGRVARSF